MVTQSSQPCNSFSLQDKLTVTIINVEGVIILMDLAVSLAHVNKLHISIRCTCNQ